MTRDEALQIKIEDYLSSIGIQVAKSVGNNLWFSLREDDKTPSFKIDTKENVWYDFGIGKGGNIIDLVQLIHGYDFHHAMLELENRKGTLSTISTTVFKDVAKQQSSMVLLKVKNLFSFPLKNYVEERGINLEIASKYFKEIEFELKGRKQFALGLKNDKGGFELRNKLLKSSIGDKAVTTINKGKDKVAVFEGMFDFLSFITKYPNAEEAYTFKILNTVSYLNFEKEDNYSIALNKLRNVFKDELKNLDDKVKYEIDIYKNIIENIPYKEYHLLLDNDEAGDKAVICFKEAFSFSDIKDQRNLYDGFVDFNEYLKDEIQNKNINKKRL